MRASVVVRTLDEAASIGRLLDLLGRQTARPEVLVVDSGSTDGTVEVVRDRGVPLLAIPRASFTYGGALNTGFAAAGGDVLVALSAHAFPRDDRWVERLVGHFADPAVACASGDAVDERFRPLAGPVRQDAARAAAHPFWGYSNAAGGVRAELWRARPFRTDLPMAEDREWAWHQLGLGHVAVIDPALVVDHDHHARDPLRACFARYRMEYEGYGGFLDLPPYGARDLLREWWADQGGHRSRARARLDPRRAARLAGKHRGLRRARGRRR